MNELDPSYLKFRQSIQQWLASPDAVRRFIAQENLLIDAEMTRVIKDAFSMLRKQQRKPRD